MRRRILLILMGVFSVVALEKSVALAKAPEPLVGKRIVRAAQSSSGSSEPLFFVDALASSRGQPRIYEYPSRRNLLYPSTNTSFFSVNIDGWIYQNKEDQWGFVLVDSFRWETYTHGWCRFRSYEGVYVREDITIIREKVHIRLTFFNADYYSHDIQARYLLDTMIDANDGAYLWQENLGLHGNEAEIYYPTNSPVQAYDQFPDPSMVGIFQNTSGTIWRMVFAAWPDAYSTVWDYTIDSSQTINHDSALLVYYDLGWLASGEQKVIEFTYGIPGDILVSNPAPGPASSWYPIVCQTHAHLQADTLNLSWQGISINLPVSLSGDLAPLALQERYWHQGYSLVATTEHYPQFKDLVEGLWRDKPRYGDLIDSWDSMEDTAAASHVLGFGFASGSIDKTIAGTDKRTERVRQIQNAGGVAIVPHPNEPRYTWNKEQLTDAKPEAIEIYNAIIANGYRTFFGSFPGYVYGFALGLWDDLLRSGEQIWGTASDDFTNNQLQWFDEGCIVVMAQTLSPTKEELKTAIRQGRFYASKGGWQNGHGAPRILGWYASPDAKKVRVVLDQMYPYVKFVTAKWYRTRWVIPQVVDGQTIAEFAFTDDDGYVRAEVHDAKGRTSFTQPIFLSRLDSKTGSWGMQVAGAFQAVASSLKMYLADAEIELAAGQSFSEVFAELVPITFRPSTSNLPAGIIGECYRFTPAVSLVGQNTLWIAFSPEELVVSSSRLRIFQSTGTGWQALTTVLEGNKAKANITSLGIFALSAVAATDNQPPQISLGSPANGSTVSGPTAVTCNASDDQGVVEVVLSLDDIFLDIDHWKADGWQFLVDFRPYPSGAHKLRALARDLAGNTRVCEIDITISGGTPAPTINLTSPAAGSDLFQHLILNGSWTDNEGLVEGIVTIGGQPVAKISFNADGTWQVDEWLTLLPILSGTQELKVIGWDAYGNQATATVPITVKVFTDIAPDFWARKAIYSIAQTGITRGCSSNPLKYCPDLAVSRAQMAVFLVRALALDTSIFDPADPETWAKDFQDVPPDYWAWKEIQALYLSGITLGTTTTTFSPEMIVSRSQMAVFLSRALGIPPLTPAEIDNSTPTFEDVPKSYWAYSYIEPFKEQGITRGCRIDGNKLYFCPDDNVDRAQMAVFLARAFGLPN